MKGDYNSCEGQMELEICPEKSRLHLQIAKSIAIVGNVGNVGNIKSDPLIEESRPDDKFADWGKPRFECSF